VNETIALRIGNAVAQEMNDALSTANLTKFCATLYLDNNWPMKLVEFETPNKEKRFFKLTFRVLPTEGHHEAYAEVKLVKLSNCNYILGRRRQNSASMERILPSIVVQT
jgi:hypothetical protein